MPPSGRTNKSVVSSGSFHTETVSMSPGCSTYASAPNATTQFPQAVNATHAEAKARIRYLWSSCYSVLDDTRQLRGGQLDVPQYIKPRPRAIAVSARTDGVNSGRPMCWKRLAL